jgi:type 1 glutamine amidotransferase
MKLSKKILVIGISTTTHMNETLGGVLMGYFRAQNMGEVTLIGSSTQRGTQPNYFTLSTFPWNRLAEYDALVTLGPIKDSTIQAVDLDDVTTTHVNVVTEFVRSGKGCVALHLAAVPFNEDFTKMIGGHFVTHPPIQEFEIQVDDSRHPITKGIQSFNVVDELYVTDYDTSSIHILLSASFEGKRSPMVWVKPYGAGRVVYIAPGHDFRTFLNPLFLQLVEQAVRWASQTSRSL